MKVVRPRSCDGVDLSPASLSEFGTVITRADLELLDRIEAICIADRGPSARLGEERLVIVCPIHRISVVDTRKTAVADETASTVICDPRSEQHEAVPASAIERQTRCKSLADRLRHLCSVWLDDGRVPRNRNFRNRRADGQWCVDRERLAHLKDQVLAHPS